MTQPPTSRRSFFAMLAAAPVALVAGKAASAAIYYTVHVRPDVSAIARAEVMKTVPISQMLHFRPVMPLKRMPCGCLKDEDDLRVLHFTFDDASDPG